MDCVILSIGLTAIAGTIGIMMIITVHIHHCTCLANYHVFVVCLCLLVVVVSIVVHYCYYLLSGDVEMNPGPMKVCPNCSVSVYIRTINCTYGSLLEETRFVR